MGDVKLMTSEIINTLNKSGAMEFDELFRTLCKVHEELDEKALEDHLMEMEIQGLIRVSKMTRNKRRIELV